MIEEIPIISINVKIWKFFSFILVHNYRRYVSVITVIIFNITQFLGLYQSWFQDQIDTIIINAYFTILYFNVVVNY